MRTPSIALFAQWPESRQKLPDHRLGAIATVEAVFRFLGIFPEVLAGHVNVRPVDRPLQLRPEALDALNVRAGRADVATMRVIAGVMLETERRDALVGAKLVGVDRAARRDVRGDLGEKAGLAVVGDNGRQNIAIALHHAHQGRLVAKDAATGLAPAAAGLPAHQRLIDLNDLADAPDQRLAVN